MIVKQPCREFCTRRRESPESSYVARLIKDGPVRIREKIDEEAGELIAAVGEVASGRQDRIIHEAADLVFHALVLLGWAGADLQEVEAELSRRFGTSGLAEKASRARHTP
jgi:phosphoribosyl-ATP pyrophosphohydrolase